MLALVLLLAAPPLQAAEDPLAPAREGKLRCIDPDSVKRNCSSIIRYKLGASGSFEASVIGIVERAPLTLISYKISGTVDGDRVCAIVRLDDILAGKLTRNGELLAPGQANTVRTRLLTRLDSLAGKRRCFIDQPDGSGIVSNVTINGLVQPQMQQRVAWVSPSEGYAIGE